MSLGLVGEPRSTGVLSHTSKGPDQPLSGQSIEEGRRSSERGEGLVPIADRPICRFASVAAALPGAAMAVRLADGRGRLSEDLLPTGGRLLPDAGLCGATASDGERAGRGPGERSHCWYLPGLGAGSTVEA